MSTDTRRLIRVASEGKNAQKDRLFRRYCHRRVRRRVRARKRDRHEIGHGRLEGREREGGEKEASPLIATLPKMQMSSGDGPRPLSPSAPCMNRNNELEKTKKGIGIEGTDGANANVESLSKIRGLSTHSPKHAEPARRDDELP